MSNPSTSSRGTATLTEGAFLALLVAGVAVPYAQAVPWLREHGPDVRRFTKELFANRISSFFGWDVIISATTLLALSAMEDELPTGQRIAVAVGALGGTSVGLPLYLLLRARQSRLKPPAWLSRAQQPDPAGRSDQGTW